MSGLEIAVSNNVSLGWHNLGDQFIHASKGKMVTAVSAYSRVLSNSIPNGFTPHSRHAARKTATKQKEK
jgi:hypothetical protein